MLLWASMLSRTFISPICHTTFRACSNKVPLNLITAETISHLPTRQLMNIHPFYEKSVLQALLIRFSAMRQFDLAKNCLPKDKLNLDDEVLQALVEGFFHTCSYSPDESGVLKKMRKEGENAGYSAPGECQERLASAEMYKVALNGSHFALRGLILRHYCARDFEGAFHLLGQTKWEYSEDYLLGIALGYDCKKQSIDTLAERQLDVGQYLKGQEFLDQKNYKEAFQWFEMARDQGLPGAQAMVDACKKNNIARGLSNMQRS